MLRDNLTRDLNRYPFAALKSCQKLEFIRALFFAYGFQATAVYRLGQWIFNHQCSKKIYSLKFFLRPVYYALYIGVKFMYGISLSRKADIGPGLYIGHFGSIKIDKCLIGENCSIHQSLHIGPEKQKDNFYPRIGSQVWIGGHVSILANVNVMDGTTISAGSQIKEDIPNNCLVAGSPARIINKNYNNLEILRLKN